MPSVSTSRVNTPSPASLATKGCSCSAGPAQPRHAHMRHSRLQGRTSCRHCQGPGSCGLESQGLHSRGMHHGGMRLQVSGDAIHAS